MVSAKRERDRRLLERDRELEWVGRILQRAQQGRGGALVVEGPAGIGKTALLAASRDKAEADGFLVLRARAGELEREFAFGVVRQLFDPVITRTREEERRRLLEGPPGVAALLLGLPGLGDGVAENAPVPPDPSFAVLHGLYWLCANLATERPLTLVIDDAQSADGASLRFLAFLLPRLEELRAALLLGTRPAESGNSEELLATLTTDPATEVLTLRPLTISGVARLVADGLGVEPEPAFGAACWEATGGTPFLVRTLVEALRDDGIAPVAGAAGHVRTIATATLDRWAMLQLVHLGPAAVRLARAVAVVERADLEQVARLSGLSVPDAASTANVLVRAGVLDEAPLGFAHPLMRAAVYREITLTERAEAHGHAARLLAEGQASLDRVAEHLLATAAAGDDWVVEQLRMAAQEATARGAPESAVTYLRRALAEPPGPRVATALMLELGEAEFIANQPGFLHHLEQVVDGASEDATRIGAALMLAEAFRMHERSAEAVAICDRVAAWPCGRDADSQWRLEAMAIASGLLEPTSAPLVAQRARTLVLEATRGPVPMPALAVAAYAAGLTNHPAKQVAELAHRAIARGLPQPFERGTTRWLSTTAFALILAERYVEAQALLDSTVTQARTDSHETLLSTMLLPRTWLALRRGDLTAAEADARAVLESPGQTSPPLLRGITTSFLVQVLVERGACDLAEREFQPLAADLHGMSLETAMLRYARARLLVAESRFAEALFDFRAVGEIAIQTEAISPSYLAWRSDAALAALAIGDADTARRLSAEELELARAFGAPRALGVALRAAGLAAGGPPGESLLREAIEVLAGPDTRLEQARALVDLGALIRRGNHRVEARDLLRRALDVAYRLGAATLAEQAETELRATGAKPRRVLLSGLEALTASERRIAELAAEGLTNREIAQALFVTARTVEGHLTSVFNKLNVETRTALPAALVAPTRADRT